MKHINKVLKNGNFVDVCFFDKWSRKEYPTKDSIVINIIYNIKEDGYISYQYSIKVPGDEYIKRVGNSITYRKWKEEKITIPMSDTARSSNLALSEKYILSILEDMYLFEVFKKCYNNRILNIISAGIADIVVCNYTGECS